MFRPDVLAAKIVLPVVMGLFLALAPVPGQPGCLATPEPASAKVSSPEPDAVQSSKGLSSEEQGKFLLTRLPGSVIGSFGSFASLLYAMEGTLIGSSSKEVLHRPLHTIYPAKEVYMPSYGEFFDMIARQTYTSFKYEPEVNVWLFDEPQMPLPYTVKKAAGWKEEDRGCYVAYIPEIAPVGMDIYMMGRYSGVSESQSKKITEIAALRFSKHIDANVTASDMKGATVDGAEAIYFESAAPQPNIIWRQWAFSKNGNTFVIVSTYSKENADKIVADVNAMVKSFHAN